MCGFLCLIPKIAPEHTQKLNNRSVLCEGKMCLSLKQSAEKSVALLCEVWGN
jgi:hypothetical protein